jgi:antirestriction protein
MTQLHAQAYSGAHGFYFESPEEFEKKYAAAKKRGIEEFEIQFIDGDDDDGKLFEALKIDQSNIPIWFEQVEDLSPDEKATLYHLATNNGESVDRALEILAEGDQHAEQGTMVDYAHEYIDSIGGVKELGDQAQSYFDYESFGRDIRLNGEDTMHLQDDLESAKESEDEEEVERLQEQIDRIESMSETELGEEIADDLGWEGVGEKNLEQYFDYDKFARDLEMGGDRYEFDFGGNTWTIDNR